MTRARKNANGAPFSNFFYSRDDRRKWSRSISIGGHFSLGNHRFAADCMELVPGGWRPVNVRRVVASFKQMKYRRNASRKLAIKTNYSKVSNYIRRWNIAVGVKGKCAGDRSRAILRTVNVPRSFLVAIDYFDYFPF